MNRSYIRAAELNASELETLDIHGTVTTEDGSVYTCWNHDGNGDLWLRRVKAADAPAAYPVIHGTPAEPDTRSWVERMFGKYLGNSEG